MINRKSKVLSKLNVHKFKWSLIPLILIIIVYLNTLRFGFVSDDRAFLINNTKLTSQPIISYFNNGVWKFSNANIDGNQLYRPLSLLNYRIQSQLWGSDPTGFHFTNFLGHILVTFLVFYLMSLLIPTASGISLALATSLFAIHPAQAEVVSWALANADIWSSFWIFLGLIFLLKPKGSRLYLFGLISVVLFLFAMLTKEVAYTVPGLVVIIILLRKNQFDLKSQILISLLSCIPLVFVLWLRGNTISNTNLVFNFEGIERMVIYFLGYIKMLVLPIPYRFYLIEPITGMVAWWEGLIGLIIVIGILILVFKSKTKRLFIILAGVWFLISLTPALAISFHGGRKTFSPRMLYLSLFSISLIATWILTNGSDRFKPSIQKLFYFLISIFMVFSFWNSSHWKNEGTFIDLAMKSTPNNVDLLINKGDYQLEIGERDEAITSYKSLLLKENAKKKSLILAHERLGELYAMDKKYQSASREFQAVLQLDPERSGARVGLGNIAWMEGNLKASIEQYQIALSLDPNNVIAQKNLQSVQNLLSRQINQ